MGTMNVDHLHQAAGLVRRAHTVVMGLQLSAHRASVPLRHVCYFVITLANSFVFSPPDFACLLMAAVLTRRHRR